MWRCRDERLLCGGFHEVAECRLIMSMCIWPKRLPGDVWRPADQVWRYMDFTKFVYILGSHCLFFPRLTELQKVDPYEGSYLPFVSLDAQGKKLKLRGRRKGPRWSVASRAFVNCWYCSENESAALWRLFPKSDEGIAIKSTIEKLGDPLGRKTRNIQS